MFTPPPSPDPRRVQPVVSRPNGSPNSLRTLDVPHDRSGRASTSPERPPHGTHGTPLSPKEDPYVYAQLRKQKVARRIKWTAILVPLMLAFVGLSTRYFAHPAALDVFRPQSDWHHVVSSAQDWRPHKRHPEPAQPSSATTVGEGKPTGTSLSLAPSASAVPTAIDSSSTKVPSSPPVLPTPFPQPFDESLSTNFQTVACQTFFTNMTQTAPFRQCRPFSLLVSDSTAFIMSQRNISFLNSIIWGTCNTVLDADTCTSNMAWFAANIKTQCKQDIAAQNPIVQDAVAGLEAYGVMREVACQVNQSTDTYCYVDAAQSTHPTDLYLYQLPLGLALPNATTPSCTPCVQRVMRAFVDAGADLAALQETYPPAAAVVNGACGAAFVESLAGFAPNGAQGAGRWRASGALAVGGAIALGMLFAL